MIKQAVKKARHFIRTHIIDKSKFLTQLNNLRIERRKQAAYLRHQTMTYAQIEAEISESYERKFGRKMNWDNPQTFNEKINVAKVYMPSPIKTRFADKYLVREWIRDKIGEEYLIPLLGIYDSFNEIDFDSLPDKFIIKCNHDSGSVTLVSDKSALDLAELKRKYDALIARNFAWPGFQMHYRDIKPKILIEEYIDAPINEFKFFCFDGKPEYCAVTFGTRYVDLSTNYYDMDYNLQPFIRSNKPRYSGVDSRPAQYDKLKSIACKLCKDFDQVRVDLYLAHGKIYTGEMTFTTANATGKFYPDEWDYKFGALWPFDNEARKRVLAKHSRPDWDFVE